MTNTIAAGTCFAILMGVAATGQVQDKDQVQDQAGVDAAALNHPIPSPGETELNLASVQALPGLQCSLYPEGSAPSTGLTVFTDDDGYARFHAVRAAAGDTGSLVYFAAGLARHLKAGPIWTVPEGRER